MKYKADFSSIEVKSTSLFFICAEIDGPTNLYVSSNVSPKGWNSLIVYTIVRGAGLQKTSYDDFISTPYFSAIPSLSFENHSVFYHKFLLGYF